MRSRTMKCEIRMGVAGRGGTNAITESSGNLVNSRSSARWTLGNSSATASFHYKLENHGSKRSKEKG